jgi:uncharacterized phage-like protein YoqJ
MKICCFAGHSKIYADKITLQEMLKDTVEKLIKEQGVKEFWCGNYGAFDKISASVVRSLKKTYKDIILCLVIPYLTKEINEYKENYYADYDEIIVADIPENTPKKYHILKANQYMINNSDFVISYVQHNWGGAAKTLEYAQRSGIKIYSL